MTSMMGFLLGISIKIGYFYDTSHDLTKYKLQI
ncbi:hypothetical protein E9M_05883 [Moraxella catarrhalis 46P47B1]|nr:hypothetical protein E9G_04984 [Moraxella catarrhalis 7169]EGE11924.1 hypothetical protein E9M_05883 [Moraxella catarrhalis 46P47B1]